MFINLAVRDLRLAFTLGVGRAERKPSKWTVRPFWLGVEDKVEPVYENQSVRGLVI